MADDILSDATETDSDSEEASPGLALGELNVSPTEITLGRSVHGRIESKGAERITWRAERDDGQHAYLAHGWMPLQCRAADPQAALVLI